MIFQIIKPRGFIALMSVIILSAMLLGLVSTANTAGFFARFNALNAEYKQVAFGLAESCANVALLSLAQNYAYDPTLNAAYVPSQGLLVSLDADSCYIQSITDVGAGSPNFRTVLITTTAGYQGSFSTVEVEATVVNPSNPGSNPPSAITINFWQEVN
jgi:hypothetical protein